jgi:hypothetical protein
VHDEARSEIDADQPEQTAGPEDNHAALAEPVQNLRLGQWLILVANQPRWHAGLPQIGGDLCGHPR